MSVLVYIDEGYMCHVTFPRDMWSIIYSLHIGHIQTKGMIPFKSSRVDR